MNWMKRCLQLAAQGKGLVAPNPLVGCVVVRNGEVLAEGFHHRFGGLHAEAHALQNSGTQDLSGSTLYVNLEPCHHFGKTPPCTEAIIARGIAHVVVGTEDPNPLVSGKGIARLREAGLSVSVGVEAEACKQINAPFFTYHRKHRPYVLLKWAQSADGRMDFERFGALGSLPISGMESHRRAHQLRSEVQAILVGANTVNTDNPKLNPRLWPGNTPLRIVISPRGRAQLNAHVFTDGLPTLLFTENSTALPKELECHTLDPGRPWAPQVFETLYQRQVQSLLVEGGQQTLQNLIDGKLWDECWVFQSPCWLHRGLKAPLLTQAQLIETHACGNDWLHRFKSTPIQIE